MIVRLWGTRGSLPTPGADHAAFGGNTACVSVHGDDPRQLTVLDAGTGIRALGAEMSDRVERVDILLSHLHLDHILGLGFFEALLRPDLEVHIWGPGSTVNSLPARLGRYLSPPLFPLRLWELPCRLSIHEVPPGRFELPGLVVSSALVCHPGPTLGFRLDDGRHAVTYLSDHEPALGERSFPGDREWTSGYDLAEGVDLLIHDAQYDDAEYGTHVGWGHSSVSQALALANMTGVRELVGFHHDPAHDDATVERLYAALRPDGALIVTPAREGAAFDFAW